MAKGLVIYDGDCTFCRRQVLNLQRFSGGRFEAISFREPGFFKRYLEVTPAECEKAIQFVTSERKKYAGAEAVARIVALNPFWLPVVWVYYIPGLRKLWDVIYENVSLNRYKISRWRWFSSCRRSRVRPIFAIPRPERFHFWRACFWDTSDLSARCPRRTVANRSETP